MGKLIVLSLDESERNIYDKILEIVSEADISIDREVDVNPGEIQIGHYTGAAQGFKTRQGSQSDKHRISDFVYVSNSSGDNAF